MKTDLSAGIEKTEGRGRQSMTDRDGLCQAVNSNRGSSDAIPNLDRLRCRPTFGNIHFHNCLRLQSFNSIPLIHFFFAEFCSPSA